MPPYPLFPWGQVVYIVMQILLKYGWWEGVKYHSPLLPPLSSLLPPIKQRWFKFSTAQTQLPLNQQLRASFSGHLYTFALPPFIILGTINNALSQTVIFPPQKKKLDVCCIMNALTCESLVTKQIRLSVLLRWSSDNRALPLSVFFFNCVFVQKDISPSFFPPRFPHNEEIAKPLLTPPYFSL